MHSGIKLGACALLVFAGTAAPVSVRVSPTTLAGTEPVVHLARACGQAASLDAEAEAGRGCTIDLNQICETSHADYVGYRNN